MASRNKGIEILIQAIDVVVSKLAVNYFFASAATEI
jgi:hypothetical protein